MRFRTGSNVVGGWGGRGGGGRGWEVKGSRKCLRLSKLFHRVLIRQA